MLRKNVLSICLIFCSLSVLLMVLFPTGENGIGSLAAYAQEENSHVSRIFIPLLIVGASEDLSPQPDYPTLEDWLTYLNSYRLMANLPVVTNNESWTQGTWYHSRYMVKNNILTHYEEPTNPYFTYEGDQAGRSGNLVGSFNNEADDRYAIDTWMQAPFHAVSILDPSLLSVGYGSYREIGSGLQMGATLDVLRGREMIPEEVEFPIMWPADGKTVNINHHWGEYPSPLTSCPGYQAPTGLAVILQLGPGDQIPQVSAHSFFVGDSVLEHCIFDETSYVNPNSADQILGRAILSARSAIVLIPREPLQPGENYTVSITTNDQTYTWSFYVGFGR
ncbi:MAG: CAP domain-containing protein [Anaerolineales bacterium]